MKKDTSHRPALYRFKRLRDFILAGKPFNAKTVAAQLEVSPKTIHRDIEFMRNFFGYTFEWDVTAKTFVGKIPENPVL